MDIQQKQLYLRDQIIDKGYDAEEFMYYFSQFGEDLGSFTLSELQNIVQDFISTKQPHVAPTPENQKDSDEDDFDDFVTGQAAQQSASKHSQQVSSVVPEIIIPQVNPQAPTLNLTDLDWGFLSTSTAPPKATVVPAQSQKPKITVPAPTQSQTVGSKVDSKSSTMKATGSVSGTTKPTTSTAKKPTQSTQIVDLLSSNPQNDVKKTTPQAITEVKPIPSINLKSEKPSNIYQEALLGEKIKVKCLKLQENILEQHLNTAFTILDLKPEQKSQNYLNKLLKGTDIIYTIKTEGRNKQNVVGISWTVKRKFSDFIWLRSMLTKFYHGLIIPPLPKEPVLDSTASLDSARNKLQHFLLEVYRRKQFRNSKYFEVFLSYQNPNDYQAYKKKCENLAKPADLASLLNMEGQVTCDYSQGITAYSDLINQFISKSSTTLKKAKEICREIGVAHDNLALKYNELSLAIKEMQTNIQGINSSNSMKYMKKMSNTYSYVSGLLKEQAYKVMRDKERFNTYYTDYFSYDRIKIQNISGLIFKRNQFAIVYQRKLNNPKEQSSGGMLSKLSSAVFGDKINTIDVPNSNFDILKQQYGYYNGQVLKETVGFFEDNVSSYLAQYTRLGHEEYNTAEELLSYWSKTRVELSRLNIDAFMG